MVKKKLDIQTLKTAAKELNEALGLDPVIDTGKKATVESLTEELEETADMIDLENDDISKDTLGVLEELGFITAPAEAPDDDTPEEGTPEEAADDDIPEDDFTDLIEMVEDAEDLKALKKLIKKEDAFESLRKEAPGMFEAGVLRTKMLACLGVEEKPIIEGKPQKGKTTEKATETKKAPEKKAGQTTLAQFLDDLIAHGGLLEDIAADVNKEAEKRGVKNRYAKSGVMAHIKYRLSKDPRYLGKMKLTEDAVK